MEGEVLNEVITWLRLLSERAYKVWPSTTAILGFAPCWSSSFTFVSLPGARARIGTGLTGKEIELGCGTCVEFTVGTADNPNHSLCDSHGLKRGFLKAIPLMVVHVAVV